MARASPAENAFMIVPHFLKRPSEEIIPSTRTSQLDSAFDHEP
jgi:hypothetical protein